MSSSAKYLISILFLLWSICATYGHAGQDLTYEQKRAVVDRVRTEEDLPTWMNLDRLLDRAVCQSPVCEDSSPAEKATLAGIKIVLCGTGQPLECRRARACTMVIAGNEALVFDVGMGAELCLNTFNNTDYSLLVKKIFITHFHSDHTGGLPNFLTLGWRTRGFKVDVYGPGADLMKNFTEGMRKFYVVDALQRETNANYTARLCDPIFHSPDEPNLSPKKYDTLQFNSVPFDAPPNDNKTRVVVYENNATGLVVETFRVDHHIANPAVGFRVTYKGKVVVISGDTVGYPVSKAVLNAAVNADVLVHEILNVTYVTDVLATGPADLFFRNCQLTESHSTVEQVANVAQAANVKQLILTHIVPTPVTAADSARFATEINQIYSGPVLVGNDYDYFLL